MIRQLIHARTVGTVLVLLAVAIGFIMGPSQPVKRPSCGSVSDLPGPVTEGAARLLVGEGRSQDRQALYRELNRYGNPVAVFGLNMRPVLWNDAATRYQGDYGDTVTLTRDGQVVGYLGRAPENALPRAGTPGSAGRIIGLLSVVFLLLVLIGQTLPLWFLSLGSLALMTRFGPLPCLVFFQAVPLLLSAPRASRCTRSVTLLLSGFMTLFLAAALSLPVNGLSLYTAMQTPAFTIPLVMALLAAAVLMLFPIHPLALVPLVIVAPIVPPAAIAGWVLLCAIWVRQRPHPVWDTVSVLVVSVGLLAVVYGVTIHRLHRLVEQAPGSFQELESDASHALDHYLELASTGGFSDLQDFIRTSGLQQDHYDFEAVYFNTIGEIVDAYSFGLPDILEMPAERGVELLDTGHGQRRVVVGTVPFKYGILTLRLSADLGSLPFLKPGSPDRDAFQVHSQPDQDRFQLSIRYPGPFYIMSDLALLALISLVLLAVFLRLTDRGRRGLLGRALFSQFSVLIGVFVVTGLVIAVQSHAILRAFSRDDLTRTAATVSRMVERDQEELSDNYMKFLGDVAEGSYGLYQEGILTFASDHLNLPVLVPYPVYRELTTGNTSTLRLAGDVAYLPLRLDRFPASILRVQPTERWRSSRLIRSARLLSLALFLVLLTSFGVTGLLVRRMVRPILQLADVSRSVAAGAYDVQVAYHRDDEIRTLVEAMTAMAQAIRDQQRNLRTLLNNVSSAVALVDREGTILVANPLFDSLPEGVRQDALARTHPGKKDLVVNDRHYQLATLDLEEPQRVVIVDDITEVVRVSRLSVITDMARQISHDIKNPLTPIRLNAEYLLSVAERDSAKLPEAVKQAVGNILKKTDELKALAVQFSDLVKASRSREPDMAPLPLNRLIEEMAAGYPSLSVSVHGPTVTVLADRMKLVRVFGNLLENSYNFTDGNGTVDIEIELHRETVTILYRDNGRGIPSRNVGRVFEPYFSTRESGTGLGLFIVREFLVEMGGTIEALPDPDGARFRITLGRGDHADLG